MLAFRKWFYKPKRNDSQLLAQFFYADEALNSVSHELDSFDGRQDPDRCTLLVNQLRMCQDKVLVIIEQLMNIAIPETRASRDFRAKFPDDVLQDNLAGQLWFGAECLAAGSTIMNREIESAALRPLARCLTRSLDTLRTVLREQSYKNISAYPPKVKEALKKFDHIFAEFELSYVSAMVPVKSAHEYDTMQDVIILFCETVNRALSNSLLTQQEIDDYDPGLMFTIPRLAIVNGLITFSDGPLNMKKPPARISELFRPFQNLLIKIKELLETLSQEEIYLLERALCSSEESWEDIERQLDQLSLRDGPLTSLEARSRIGAASGLSSCSSCDTESDRLCSSVQSLTPCEDKAVHDGSVRRKESIRSNQSFLEEEQTTDVPGMVNEKITSMGERRVIRRRKCSQETVSPQMSPDSLEGFSPAHKQASQRRRKSSQVSDIGLEDSGHFTRRNSSSRSVDSSPQFRKRTARNFGAMRERASSDNSSLSPLRSDLAQNDAQVLRREDSGLGSAPNGDLMELYIQEVQLHDPSGDGLRTESRKDEEVSSVIPSQSSRAGSREGFSKDQYHNNAVIVEMQGNELIVKDPSPFKISSGGNTSRITMDFTSNFPIFGKGKPSTELNTTGTVGNCVHREVEDSDAFNRAALVSNRHSDSSLSLDGPSARQSQNEVDMFQHVSVRPSRSEPSFRFPFRSGSYQQVPAAQGSNTPSAMNRITGSRGIVRQPTTSGSDGEESSDLSSSASSSSCSSCCSSGSDYEEVERDTDYKWESDDSSETNSLISENNDEQEITMAIQAAQLAARQQVRSQFRSSSDLVHRLFVCIAGVADQLQTNFASDLRSILKTVFEVTVCNPIATEDSVFTPPAPIPATNGGSLTSTTQAGVGGGGNHGPGRTQATEGSRDGMGEGRERRRHRSNSSHRSRRSNFDDPPQWMPDESSDECMACHSSFTVIRRKHHCRNCGQIFCARCSANSVPLPRYGQMKPVRVCNRCYMFHVTPFQP